MSISMVVQHPEPGWDQFVCDQRVQFVTSKRQAEDDFQSLQAPDCDNGSRGDEADQVADLEIRLDAAARKARLINTVSQYASAIEAIDAGTYGVCEVCGGPIPLERMEILPFATTHVGCNSKGSH